MARFYGSIQGARGEATRLGHERLETYAASWSGAIRVCLYHDKDQDVERFIVEQTAHHGAGCNRGIARGIVGEPVCSIEDEAPADQESVKCEDRQRHLDALRRTLARIKATNYTSAQYAREQARQALGQLDRAEGKGGAK